MTLKSGKTVKVFGINDKLESRLFKILSFLLVLMFVSNNFLAVTQFGYEKEEVEEHTELENEIDFDMSDLEVPEPNLNTNPLQINGWIRTDEYELQNPRVRYRLDNTFYLSVELAKLNLSDTSNYLVYGNLINFGIDCQELKFDNNGKFEFDFYNYMNSYTLEGEFTFTPTKRVDKFKFLASVNLIEYSNNISQKFRFSEVFTIDNPLKLKEDLEIENCITSNPVEIEHQWFLYDEESEITYANYYNHDNERLSINSYVFTPKFGIGYFPIRSCNKTVSLILRGIERTSAGTIFWEHFICIIKLEVFIHNEPLISIENNDENSTLLDNNMTENNNDTIIDENVSQTQQTSNPIQVGLTTEAVGSASIHVNDDPGGSITGAIVVLYDDGYAPLDKSYTTDGGGWTPYFSLEEDNYIYEVYYDDSSTHPGTEFWGSDTFTITPGASIPFYFIRTELHSTAIRFPWRVYQGDNFRFEIDYKCNLVRTWGVIKFWVNISTDQSTYLTPRYYEERDYVTPAADTLPLDFDTSIYSLGTYYVRFSILRDNNLLLDESPWYSFEVVKPSGGARFIVTDEDNVPADSFIVYCYDTSWSFLNQGIAVDIDRIDVWGLDVGLNYYIIMHEDNPQIANDEYWGSGEVTVSKGVLVAENFRRTHPYVSSVDSAIVTVGTVVNLDYQVNQRLIGGEFDCILYLHMYKDGTDYIDTYQDSHTVYYNTPRTFSFTIDTSSLTTGDYLFTYELTADLGGESLVDELGEGEYGGHIEVLTNKGDIYVYVEDMHFSDYSGIEVILFDLSDNIVDTEYTDSNGRVIFTNIVEGTYYSLAYYDFYSPNGLDALFGYAVCNVVADDSRDYYLDYAYVYSVGLSAPDVIKGDSITIRSFIDTNIQGTDFQVRCNLYISRDQSTNYIPVINMGQMTFNYDDLDNFFEVQMPTSIWALGTYYVRAEISTYVWINGQNSWEMTDETGWDDSFVVISNVGDIEITVRDDDGSLVTNARVVLFESDYLAENAVIKYTDASGVVTFSSKPYGIYYYEIYYNEFPDTTKDAYWGGAMIELDPGEFDQINFIHNNPHLDGFAIPTTAVVDGSIHMEFYISNDLPINYEFMLIVIISKDGSVLVSNETVGIYTINAGIQNALYGYTCQTTGWSVGNYYVRIELAAFLGPNPRWYPIDEPNWLDSINLEIDSTAPLNPTNFDSDPNIGEGTFGKTVTISWWGETDLNGVGVAGFSFILTKNPYEVPGFAINTTLNDYTFDNLQMGTYYFIIRTVDNNGNWAQNCKLIGPIYVLQRIGDDDLDEFSSQFLKRVLSFLIGDIPLNMITYNVNKEFLVWKVNPFGLVFFEVVVYGEIKFDGINNELTIEFGIEYEREKNLNLRGLALFKNIQHALSFFNFERTSNINVHYSIIFEIDNEVYRHSEFGGAIELGIKITVNYLKLLFHILLGAPVVFNKVYDFLNWICSKIRGGEIIGFLTGSISFILKFEISKTVGEIGSSCKFTFEIDMNLVEINLDNDPTKELVAGLSGDFYSCETFCNITGKYRRWGFDGLNIVFIIQDIPNFAIFLLKLLRIDWSTHSTFELNIQIIKPYLNTILLSKNLDIDTDGDGIKDIDELSMNNGYITDINEIDSDGDCLTDFEEIFDYNTNPNNIDTDSDGLWDDEEANGYVYENRMNRDYPVTKTAPSDPNNVDSDSDGIDDFTEIFTFNTNPNEEDTDTDGLTDYEEIMGINLDDDSPIYTSNPNLVDSDFDGVDDLFESKWWNTDPNDPFDVPIIDNDDDLIDDTWEDSYGLDSSDDADCVVDQDIDDAENWQEFYLMDTEPNNPDTDSDQMIDGWEYNNELDPLIDDSALDPDSDSLSNIDEWNIGTSANNPDTDYDGLTDYEEVYTYPEANPLLNDTDSDLLNDSAELFYGTIINNPDTDSDTMLDGWEILNNLNPLVNDALLDDDSDGLTNLAEFGYGTNPQSNDTDNDLLLDGEEINTYLTNATNDDSDQDGLLDGEEIITYSSDPLSNDTDSDLLTDWQEAIQYGTDLNDSDTDNDLLDDYEEVMLGLDGYQTNATNPDSDFDQLSDFYEYQNGTDPWNPDCDSDLILDGEEVIEGTDNYVTDPLDPDTDGDGLDDWEEVNAGSDGYLTNPTDADSDNDQLNDGEEQSYSTDPNDADSDDDNLSDYDEIFTHSTDPNDMDSDDDLFDDDEEVTLGVDGYLTDPNDSDTDSDGLTDWDEYDSHGTDPTDEDSDDDLLDDLEEVTLGVDGHQTNANEPDSDFDGLTDYYEYTNSTDPWNPDCDGEGILDGEEVIPGVDGYITDPLDSDTDDDALDDLEETTLGSDGYLTDPTDADSDDDGLEDGEEPSHGTDPNDADCDDDGFNDWEEVNAGVDGYVTDPNDEDSDDDGLNDPLEQTYGTDPNDEDCDGDTILDGEEVIDGADGYTTDPLDEDTDGDTIRDDEEIVEGADNYETDPTKPDTDGDTIRDDEEVTVGADNYITDPNNPDTDGDHLTDDEETSLGSDGHLTDPTDPDSDDDDLDDFEESQHSTDPNDPDSDDDSLLDGEEVNDYGTDPNDDDSDDDNLSDGEEVNNYGTDPADDDSDNDRLPDDEEVFAGSDTFITDPLNNDTDGDGLHDGDEVLDYDIDPTDTDSDDDTMTDGYEVDNGLDPDDAADASDDEDGDGLLNIEEFNNGTRADNPHSDSDELTDYEEIMVYFTNATNPDSDFDGLFDHEEVLPGDDGYITDPWDEDSDDDELTDYEETVIHYTNPLDDDHDNDRLLDGQEIDIYETDPKDPDSDDDFLLDGEEVIDHQTDPLDSDDDDDGLLDGDEVHNHETDPKNPDSDDDDLNDLEEVTLGSDGFITDPNDSDTDNDSLSDGEEYDIGTDPTDPKDPPASFTPTPITTTTPSPTGGFAYPHFLFVFLGLLLVSVLLFVFQRKKKKM